MTEEKLDLCEDAPDLDAGDGEVPVYAVAHRRGVVQNTARRREYEALAVLYVTADGERAVERWVTPAELSATARALCVDESALSESGEGARTYAPIARKHPEVA